jgi:hypothetical protein
MNAKLIAPTLSGARLVCLDRPDLHPPGMSAIGSLTIGEGDRQECVRYRVQSSATNQAELLDSLKLDHAAGESVTLGAL